MPMYKDQVERALNLIYNNKVNRGSATLVKVLAADELAKINLESKNFLFVVLIKKNYQNIGHMVVIDGMNFDEVIYFDSFGQYPQGLIKNFLSKFENVTCNPKELQHHKSVACGAYCIYYANMRFEHKSLDDIVNEFVLYHKNKYGTLPSEARDFDLYQSIFTHFKIKIKPLNDALLYCWQLYPYLSLTMNEHVISHALHIIRETYENYGNITLVSFPAEKLNELIFLKSDRVICVVNTRKSGEESGHWVLIDIKSHNEVEFFDPLGKPPEGLIEDFISKFEKRPHNKFALQHYKTKACGAYCIYYAYERYMNNSRDEIIDSFLLKYKEKFDHSPSIPRDFHLFYDVCNLCELSIEPPQDYSPLFWHMFLPMVESQIIHAFKYKINVETFGNVTIRAVITADELINLELKRGIYLVNNSPRDVRPGRWVLIEIKNCNEVEFFDSLGILPVGLIADFISKFEKGFYNQDQIQHHETMACGAYCIYYAFMRYMNKSKDEIIKDLVSGFKNNYGIVPSKVRDYEFYRDIFLTFSIPPL